MLVYLLIFVACALFGFIYGKKAHLKQVASVLLQMKMPEDQVGKVVSLVSEYSKLQREAKKATKDAYKKALVDAQLEKMKKEDKTSG